MINKTRILLLDTENTPSLGWVWGKYEQDVLAFDREWYMLSFAYKWLGDKTIQCKALPNYKGYTKDKTNDKRLLEDLWNLLDEADIVIGHNVDRFDIRKINARFLKHGFNPPSPYRTVDTVKLARKHFMLNSNKLDDLGSYLGVGRKASTGGFQLWLDCMNGVGAAWKKMIAYNKQDVALLEDVYLALRGWATNHPNVNLVENQNDGCPICGGKKNIQKRGFRYSKTGKAQAFQHLDCGGWFHGQYKKVQ
jgi:hypothetical protein